MSSAWFAMEIFRLLTSLAQVSPSGFFGFFFEGESVVAVPFELKRGPSIWRDYLNYSIK